MTKPVWQNLFKIFFLLCQTDN